MKQLPVFGAEVEVELVFDPRQFGVGQPTVKSHTRRLQALNSLSNKISHAAIMPDGTHARHERASVRTYAA